MSRLTREEVETLAANAESRDDRLRDAALQLLAERDALKTEHEKAQDELGVLDAELIVTRAEVKRLKAVAVQHVIAHPGTADEHWPELWDAVAKRLAEVERLSAQVARVRECAEEAMKGFDEETTGIAAMDEFFNAAMDDGLTQQWLESKLAAARKEALAQAVGYFDGDVVGIDFRDEIERIRALATTTEGER
jgi:hypothetical protein